MQNFEIYFSVAERIEGMRLKAEFGMVYRANFEAKSLTRICVGRRSGVLSLGSQFVVRSS